MSPPKIPISAEEYHPCAICEGPSRCKVCILIHPPQKKRAEPNSY